MIRPYAGVNVDAQKLVNYLYRGTQCLKKYKQYDRL